MNQLSDQPTIDINKIVQKYQAIVADLQLQNILLNLRLEETQSQLTAAMTSQALGQTTIAPPNTASPKAPSKAKN